MPTSRIVRLPAKPLQAENPFDASDTEDILWDKLFATASRSFGVTSMLYGFTHSKFTISRAGMMPSLYLRHSYPEDYLATYPGGFALDDCIAPWLILEGQTLLFWDDFTAMDLRPAQRERIAKDQACGMGTGVSFGFKFGANSGVAGLCLAARHADAGAFKALVLARRSGIESLAAAFDGLMRPAMIRGRIQLTIRERDVLSYSAGGMSAKQIAEHLDLSPKTVVNTLERARRAMGAVSTMEAVAKALIYELIQ
jgi:DNA-binding CsgD family transcriptional regulator